MQNKNFVWLKRQTSEDFLRHQAEFGLINPKEGSTHKTKHIFVYERKKSTAKTIKNIQFKLDNETTPLKRVLGHFLC